MPTVKIPDVFTAADWLTDHGYDLVDCHGCTTNNFHVGDSLEIAIDVEVKKRTHNLLFFTIEVESFRKTVAGELHFGRKGTEDLAWELEVIGTASMPRMTALAQELEDEFGVTVKVIQIAALQHHIRDTFVQLVS
jgi:hypothetical protein